METSLNINEILSQVKKLDKDEQLTLLERLVQLVRKTQSTSALSLQLTSLSGLGSEVWKDTNIEEYLETERQW